MSHQFSDFIYIVEPQDKEFVVSTHNGLVGDGYKAEIGARKTGMYISYSHPKTKRAFLHLFFRSGKLQSRVYTEGQKNYADFIDKLPEEQEQRISEVRKCNGCAPTCTKGYALSIRGNEYYPCRYYAFHLDVNKTTKPIILDLIKLEKASR